MNMFFHASVHPRCPLLRAPLWLSASVVLLGLLNMPLHAQTLQQILREAQEIDPQLALAKATRLMKGDSVIQERARLLPQVGMTFDRRRIENTASAASSRAYDSQNASLSLRQSLFNPAQWQSYQQSKLGDLIGGITQLQAEQALRLRVAVAYITVLAAREDVVLYANRVRTLEDVLHGVKRRFEEGRATVIDVSQANADLTAMHSQAVAAEGEFNIASSEIAELVGHPVGNFSELKPALSTADFARRELSQWLEQAEQNDFNVHLQMLALHVSEREIKKAKAEFLPTVDLVGSFSQGKAIFAPGLEINNSSVRQGSNSLGVTVTVPIFNGFASTARVSQARHQVAQANAELSRARQAARSAASRAFLSGRSSLDQIEASGAALQSAQFAFDAVKKGYDYGKKSLTDVSLAADKLFQASRDRVRSQHNFYTNYVNLLSSAGALDDAAISMLSGGSPSISGGYN